MTVTRIQLLSLFCTRNLLSFAKVAGVFIFIYFISCNDVFDSISMICCAAKYFRRRTWMVLASTTGAGGALPPVEFEMSKLSILYSRL